MHGIRIGKKKKRQIISDSTFSMGSKSVISPIVMSKRLNGPTEKGKIQGSDKRWSPGCVNAAGEAGQN